MPHPIRCLVVASVLFSITAIGCGRSGPPRVPVHGAILFQHEPLKAGRISFIPTDGSKGPASVATVTNGFYDFDLKTGPVIGKHKVQIESIVDPGFELDDEAAYARAALQQPGRPVLPQQPVPAEFNTRTTLTVTVSPDGEQKLDFSLDLAKN